DISAELIQLEDIELLKKFLLRQTHAYVIEIDPHLLIKAAERFGWKPFAQAIASRLTAQNSLQWLDALAQTGQAISEEGQDVMRTWVTSRWRQSLTSAMQPVVEPTFPSTARARHRYSYEMARFHTEKRAKQHEILHMDRYMSLLTMS